MPLRMALTPRATKARRVRRRAVAYFKVGAERRTASRSGVLLYLSLAEHRAEIIADSAVHAKVPPELWGEAMAALVDAVRAGRPGEGMAAAVTAISVVLAEHFPRTGADPNELPDRLIEL
jgi:putative membrane protein